MIGRLAAVVAGLTKGAVAVFMAAMAAVIVAEVFGRYVLNSSIYFSEELSRFCFIWAGFLGASLALREGGHIGMTFVVDRLGPAAGRRALVAARLLVLLLLGVVVVAGASVLPDQWAQQTSTLGFSVFWFYLAVPLGAALAAVQALALLCSRPSR
ncbi:MAG: TRAP transporter small permease [Candidatus Rokubacteria bacterium]|nr:TRAP transporter small permease [Candidatus Rokubacteria bacterium]MBI4592668.1 TRAP transporter small permease [Candidatus Rokubacteria bacterium]